MRLLEGRFSRPRGSPCRCTMAATVNGGRHLRRGLEIRAAAHVTELADVGLGDHWPDGLRGIVRREPRHPGAQQTFDDIDGHRFVAVLTDSPGGYIAALEAAHRASARVENRIRDAKATGLRNLPCGDFDPQPRLGCPRAGRPHIGVLDPDNAADRSAGVGVGTSRNAAVPDLARRRTCRPTRPPHYVRPCHRLAMGHRPTRRIHPAMGAASTHRLTPGPVTPKPSNDPIRPPTPAGHRQPARDPPPAPVATPATTHPKGPSESAPPTSPQASVNNPAR